MNDPPSLPDRLDDALAALWAGSSDALDRLFSGGSADSPAIGQVLGASATTFQHAFGKPKDIGGFEILGELGRGGMGIVYRARQADLDRLVALKVIRGADFGDEQRVRLFQREVHTLARLRHPNIAALYGANKTDDGRHYFVMELISGVPLSEFVSQATNGTAPDAASLPRILAVFCKVCDAITHAHQKGVIHRDIKPSNILVSAESPLVSAGLSSSDSPEVKVLDFGLARVADPDAAALTATMDASRLKGTLPYMSPEQIEGDPEDVDIRADVYSLGVVLYQILTGQLPFDSKKRSMTEMITAIRTEIAPRPASVNPVLRGDLETIVLKAIERDPGRRYQSAAALGDDIRRFLTNQPIQARPAGFAYLARKLVARHKLAFAASAVILVVSLAAGAISAVSLVQTRAARRSAESERQVADSVSQFLVDTFSHIDPRLARSRDTTLIRELLYAATRRTESELADQPRVRCRLYGTFGNAFVSLGLYDQAEPHLVLALSLSTESFGPDHPEAFTAMNNLATLRSDQGRNEDAARLHQSALEARVRVLGEDHPDTAMSKNNLGELYRQMNRLPDAENLLQQSLDSRRRLLGDEHRETLVTMNNLAGVWVVQRKWKKAEVLLRECLIAQGKTLPQDHPDLLVTKSDLAIVLGNNGKSDEAETTLREVIDGFTRQLGAGHMDTLIARYNLAAQERKRQAPDQAVEAMERLTADADGYLPAGHHLLGSIRSTLARRMFDVGRFAEAEPHAVRAFNELESSLGQSHMTTRAAADTVADIYEALKQPDRAAPYRTLSDSK